jgi:hypothetical protein
MSILSILYLLISIMVLTYILSVLFNFLGIDFATYSNYLLWVIALIIFFMVLPTSKGSNLF